MRHIPFPDPMLAQATELVSSPILHVLNPSEASLGSSSYHAWHQCQVCKKSSKTSRDKCSYLRDISKARDEPGAWSVTKAWNSLYQCEL